MNRWDVRSIDWQPLMLVPVLALLALPLIGSGSTWLTLTVAGLAMGMIIFIIASGLTLVFGLMDVLNFGHGVFIAVGAFVATTVLGAMTDWTGSGELWRNLVAVLPAMVVAMLVTGATTGFPLWGAMGAKEAGGVSVGLSPASSERCTGHYLLNMLILTLIYF